MGISNLASGLRTGVCTSTTRPTAPYNGQVIYETDSKQTLVWQGSAWVMLTDADTPPGLQLIKTQTIGTTVSSVSVTDCFSSDFEAYRITVTGGASSVDENMTLKLGSSTTGYYDVVYYNASNNLTTPAVTGSANTNTVWYRVGTCSANGIQLDINLINVSIAKYSSFYGQYNFHGSIIYMGFVGGIHAVATAYTGMTLAPASGTLTGGTIRVYGLRNAV